LYPSIITPEGKKKMFIEDFIRGIKWTSARLLN
jgi:hypothetical protein